MTIEEALKTEKFESEYQRLLCNIMYTNGWVVGLQQRFFKDYDLTLQQYNILRILRGQKGKPLPLNSITERMIDRMSNTSRIVDRLEKKSLVSRKTCPKDRRQVDVLITEKGLEKLEVIDKNTREMEEGMNQISEEKARKLNDLLDEFRSE
ncbi:MarR family winged helix-turn-helix transcriptional regulator [Halocola ammonii]